DNRSQNIDYPPWSNEPSSNFPNTLGKQVYLHNVTNLPTIQHKFTGREKTKERLIRERRRNAIRKGFLHAWRGYTKYAWGHDELLPVSNQSRDNFNGWGATIVDSLDTLWIMNLTREFDRAKEFVRTVDFTTSENDISVFETTIRYLGGLLSAYEFSREPILLEKALELGTALLPSFNSPSGLPYNTWNLTRGRIEKSVPQLSPGILSQAGTLQLEFMKLAQLSGESEFFYKVQNITNVLDRAKKSIQGLYPIQIDQDTGEFIGNHVSFGAQGDSFYEYLIKEYIYVGGAIDQYRRMYVESIDSMHEYLIEECQVEDRSNLLFIGELSYAEFSENMHHLACFVPGMLSIGAKVLNRPKDLEVAIKLAETCYWSYEATYTGIGAESMWFISSHNTLNKIERDWIESMNKKNGVPSGLLNISPDYYLRPETVESLFILYRITGDKKYQEKGWKIWQAINKWCKTPAAYSGLTDVTSKFSQKNNQMESFFLAETLKYLYLLFSPPDFISLDKYVFNTEAHPLLRMLKNSVSHEQI
ncbi:16528_t:CDS:10, partial [Acaulospora morrowiae]